MPLDRERSGWGHYANVLGTLDFSVAASASEWTDHHSLVLAATRQIKV